MLRTVVLLLTLAACATGAPGSYRQAAPAYMPVQPPPAMTPGYFPGTPAEPVYTPAGAGLPGEHVPGQVAPEVPRSQGRMLPRTDEPGLWAADDAPAASRAAEPWLLNLYLPELATVPPSEHLAKLCADQMTSALARLPPHLMQAVDDGDLDTSFTQGPCIAARLYQLCAQLHLSGRSNERGLDVARALADAARLVTAHCPEKARTPAVEALIAALRSRYFN